MNIKNKMQNKISWPQKTIFMISFIWNVQNKQIYRPKKWISGFLALCRSGDIGKQEMILKRKEFFFWGDENVLTLTVKITVQLYAYTKNHWIIHFK